MGLVPKLLSFKYMQSFIVAYVKTVYPIFKNFKPSLIKIAVYDFVGAGCLGAIIGIIGFYVNLVDTKEVFELNYLGYKISILNNYFSIVSLGALIFLLICVGAWTTYKASLSTRNIGRNVHKTILHNIIKQLQKRTPSSSIGLENNQEFTINKLKRNVLRNSVQLGIAAETIVRAIRPLSYSLVGFGLIMFIDVNLSVILIFFSILCLPIITNFSKKTSSKTRLFYESRVNEYGRDIVAVLNNLDSSSLLSSNIVQVDDYVLKIPSVTPYLDGYDEFLLANNKMSFIVTIMQSAIFGLILIMLGMQVLDGDKSWGEMMAYMIALLALVNSMKTLMVNYTTLSRLYVSLQDYNVFMKSQIEKEETSLLNELTITADDSRLTDSKNMIILKPGDKTFLKTDMMPTRFDFDKFIKPFENNVIERIKLWNDSEFVLQKYQYLCGTLLDNFVGKFKNKNDKIKIKEIIVDFDLANEINSLENGINTQINEDVWRSFSNNLKAAIRLFSVIFSENKILFIEQSIILECSDEFRKKFLTILEDKIVLFMLLGNRTIESELSSNVIFVSSGKILGIGDLDWYLPHENKINEEIKTNVVECIDDSSEESSLLF